MRKSPPTLSMAKPRHSAETILKNLELFIYGDVLNLNNSVCKNAPDIQTP
jgi:hypothetical protein